MTSKRQKGSKFQDWIVDWLIKVQGIDPKNIHNQKPVAKQIMIKKFGVLKPIWVSQRNDLFGAYDIVYVDNEGATHWIQATLDTGIGRKRSPMVQPFNSTSNQKEIWQKVDRNTVRILDENGIEQARIIKRKLYRKE